jgi:hypothetical protein
MPVTDKNSPDYLMFFVIPKFSGNIPEIASIDSVCQGLGKRGQYLSGVNQFMD